MSILIDFLYVLAAMAIAPVALYRCIRFKRYRRGWRQRFGNVTRRDPAKKCIWIHAVSVGEVNAARTIIQQLGMRFGDYEILVSTTTDTGFARASSLFAKDHTVCYFPLDFSWTMRRAFGNINPSVCILMELEVWPNLVRVARRAGVPVVVANGRISDKSFATYRKARPLVKKMFEGVTLVLAQTDEYARRFRILGCPNVMVSGSLKYDTAQTDDQVDGAEALAAQLGLAGRRLWVAGGTGNDEEAIILEVYKRLKQDGRFADLRLAVVPRKPERFDEVARLIRQNGLELLRYSLIKQSPGKTAQGQTETAGASRAAAEAVILGDTMGDLRKFYSIATVVFVGRSLVPMGGSDMMEAAALGKCTIFGPHAFNFRQTVSALLADNGAILVNNKDELLQALEKCLTSPAYAEQIARAGREVILKNQGATEKTIREISGLLANSK